jgi:hypothetical protein
MSESLPAYLKRRAARSLAYLLREAEQVSTADAFRGRRDDWPPQPWGIGQDGSIAGIACHVAAWKHLTLPLLTGAGVAAPRASFDLRAHVDPDDWPAILSWLRATGGAWNAAVDSLPEAEFDAIREWEGAQVTVAKIATELIQHDVQHAAQIEYLRQLYSLLRAEPPPL